MRHLRLPQPSPDEVVNARPVLKVQLGLVLQEFREVLLLLQVALVDRLLGLLLLQVRNGLHLRNRVGILNSFK